jgi:membrane fusion protein (multidrug efflux system)
MAKKKDLKIYIPLTITILLVIVIGIYWYKDYVKYIKTDDALVSSDVISVSPKIMGRINKLYVEEGDSVKKGQLIAELDSTDILAQKQQVISGKALTMANKVQAEAKLTYDQKNIKVLQISIEKAKEDFDRSKTQFAGGVTTKEQLDHMKKALETAQAQFEAAQAQLTVSKSMITTAQTAVEGSKTQINVINTQLNNTRLYAPVDGVVAKRWLLPGDISQPGQSIYTINNNSRFWVVVYLEETKVEKLRIGQKAIFSLDMYPDVVFTGTIFTLGSTTAAQFSLIPPSNASGNFTKVTQRVPLKVSIDATENGTKLTDYKLLTGMSAVVKIIK